MIIKQKYSNKKEVNINNKNNLEKEMSTEHKNLLNSTKNGNNKKNLNENNNITTNDYVKFPKFNISINSIMKEEHFEEIIYFRHKIKKETYKNLNEEKTNTNSYKEKKRDQNYLEDNETNEGKKQDKIRQNFAQNEKNIKKFSINIEMLRKEEEMQIQKKIENIKDSNLTYIEKLLIILSEETDKYYKIRDDNFDEKNKTYNEKTLKKNENEFNIINNNSENLNKDKNINDSIEIKNYNENQENKSLSLNDSSLEVSKINESIIYEQKEKQFNSFRASFYIKNKLYDICLIKENSKNFLSEIYKIKENYKAFLYPNDLKTYCITQSGFLFKEKKENYSGGNTDSGLFFCGKTFVVDKEEKKCLLNQFICFECMKYNKKIYNIKDHYLININGRIAKINKGKYHCFGHFLVGNQIEDCIKKFICKACELLQKYSEYYNQKNNLM